MLHVCHRLCTGAVLYGFRVRRISCLHLQVTNALAAIAMCGGADALSRCKAALKAAGIAHTESFEVALNHACAAVAADDDGARELLDAAHTKGQEALVEDEATDEVRTPRPVRGLCISDRAGRHWGVLPRRDVDVSEIHELSWLIVGCVRRAGQADHQWQLHAALGANTKQRCDGHGSEAYARLQACV